MTRAARYGVLLGLGLVAGLDATSAEAQFSYLPPGNLIAGSGIGRVDSNVYAPDMRFPMESAPAYANSQVYRPGGVRGGGGGQCHSSNYSYPWQDNYCESRSHSMPMCAAGVGHQGQDIRAATCDDNVHWVVAAADGTITQVGMYSVYVTADDGRRYDYLHMRSVVVRPGQRVTRGQRLGRVSNAFRGTPTTVHLHFNIRMNVAGVGSTFAPTYLSLVRSYERLLGVGACEAGSEVCDARDNDCDSRVDEEVPGGCGGWCTATAVAGAEAELFKDLPRDGFGWAEAAMLFNAGITNGCSASPRMFCPKCPIPRAQLVTMLVRAAGISTAGAPASPTFSDVPTDHRFYAEIEAVAREGITTGCGGGRFCPDDIVTRAQMASFLRRTVGWPQIAGRGTFSDVDSGSSHYRDIETIYDRCVTYGCGGDRYCPDDEVTRAMAAVFIARAFNLEGSNACLIESCNGVDDDLDGTVDEGVTSACGDCASAPAEVCNGEDDDCDGESDEGVANACGECGALPAEVCNGVDDNCDGTIDEGCPGAPDGGAPRVDAGASRDAGGRPADAGRVPVDASTRSDGGSGGPLEGGCGCRAAGAPRGRLPAWLALVGVIWWARRRPGPAL